MTVSKVSSLAELSLEYSPNASSHDPLLGSLLHAVAHNSGQSFMKCSRDAVNALHFNMSESCLFSPLKIFYV